MASNTIKGLTVEIGGDTTKLGKAIKDVEAKSRSLSKELGDINKLLKMDPGNMDLLAQKQKVLGEAAEAAAKKLETLKEAEQQVQKQFERGEVSEEQLRALQREIVATENKMKGYQKAAQQTAQEIERLGNGADEAADDLGETGDEAKKSAKNVDDFADAADNAEKSSSNLGSTLANVAKAGFTAVTAAIAAAITGLVAAAESTREYRTEMGKLEAAFSANNHSAETATKTYQTLQGVIGETDQSVEAAQQISLLAQSEEDAAKWAGLAAGVVGQFGDALQPETFYEAANETLKLGEATGAFTQMLEGTGMSVEDFNAGLAACTTEAEKQAYMLQVAETALGAAGEKYKEVNGEIIRANQANDAWMQSLAGVGGAIEPILTDIKLMGASLLADAVPGVQALADAFRGLLNGDEGAAGDFATALSGMVTGLVTKITEALPAIAQVGLSIISTLGTSLVQQLPVLLSTGGQIVGQLLSGIASALPGLVQSALSAIGSLVSGLQSGLPQVLAKGREILMNLATGIKENLPNLVSQALDIIMNFATTIYDNAPTLIQTGFDVLSNLVQGILNSLPVLLSKAPEIISKFANVINDNFPTILAKGVQLIWEIIKGIISAIPTLIANIPKIITAIVDVWEAFNWLNLGKKAITWLKDGVLKMVGAVKSAGKNVLTSITDALKNLPSNLLKLGKNAISDLGSALRNGVSTVKNGASAILNGIVNYFKTLPSKLLSIGQDLVRGLWNGISDMTGWVIGKIQSFGSSVLSGIKSFFGIHSPSRVFRDEVGAMLAEGMAEGIEESADAPLDAMAGLSNDLLGQAMALDGMSLGAPSINGLGVERGLQTHTAAAQAAAAYPAGIGAKLDAILAAIENGQVLTIDKKLLVGGTANEYDSILGQRRALVARGAL